MSQEGRLSISIRGVLETNLFVKAKQCRWSSLAIRVVGNVKLVTERGFIESLALFDTGATKSFVDVEIAERLGYKRYERPKEVHLTTRDAVAEIVGCLTARVIIENVELPLEHTFGVIKGLRSPIIIGMDIIEPYEIVLDVREGKVKFKKIPPELELI